MPNSKKKPMKPRMSQRVCIYFQASFRSEISSARGHAAEISGGGMLFCSPKRLFLHEKGVFSLEAFENEPALLITAEIINIRHDEDSSAYYYGVKFTEPAAQKDSIERVLRYAVVRERYLSRKPKVKRIA